MATFVLIHRAGDSGWYRHLVAPELLERGHDVVTPDLPADDDTADLGTYADAVVGPIGGHDGLVVVGQSFGAFTAPLVCDRIPAELPRVRRRHDPVAGRTPGRLVVRDGLRP